MRILRECVLRECILSECAYIQGVYIEWECILSVYCVRVYFECILRERRHSIYVTRISIIYVHVSTIFSRSGACTIVVATDEASRRLDTMRIIIYSPSYFYLFSSSPDLVRATSSLQQTWPRAGLDVNDAMLVIIIIYSSLYFYLSFPPPDLVRATCG